MVVRLRRGMLAAALLAAAAVVATTADSAAGAGSAVAQGGFTVAEIIAPGANEVIARDVNSRGEVVGEFRDAQGIHGFLLDTTGLRDLSVSSPGFVPRAISDLGVMVGTLDVIVNGTLFTHAAVKDTAGPVRDLGTLGGGNSVAIDVNSAGQVVGSSETAGGTQLAFLSSGSGMTQIGPAGGFLVSATSINEQGQVVGSDNRGDFGRSEAFLYENGATTLLAQDSGSQGAFASGINAAGVISGWIDHYYGTTVTGSPFRWQGGVPAKLGPFGRGSAINCNGDIVGSHAAALGDPQRAALFRQSQVIDLAAELPIGDGGEAVAINGGGRIVVNQSVGGLQHAYVLTPTTPAQECADTGELALARAFRPYLRFDDTEPWRPISLDALLAESVNGNPAHQVCHARQLLPDQCQSVTTTADLLAFEAAQPGGNSLDISGDQRSIMPFGSVDQGYAAPSLEGCAIPAPRDCDSGPTSVIYYNRTVAEGLDGAPGARSYWDYWWFFRYNHSDFSTCRFGILAVPGLGQICYEHEGDWEGVTVVTSVEPAPPDVYWVAYSAHGTAYRYAAEALAAAGRLDAGHAKAYIASGSHAAYPSPCQRTSLGLCPQQEALTGDVPRPDGAYDGEIPWSGNLDQFCGTADSCVQPLPEANIIPTTLPDGNANDWNAWTGLWGRGCTQMLNECTRAKGPETAGLQQQYRTPWLATTTTRIPAGIRSSGSASARARIRAEARCSSWLGPQVAALACDEKALYTTLATNRFDRRGAVSIDLGRSNSGTASFPGLAQTIGSPVRPGESVSIRVEPGARGRLWLRVRGWGSVATARFDVSRLGSGGIFTLGVRGSATAPRVVLLGRGRSVRATMTALKKMLMPPTRLRAVRGQHAVKVSFRATGERTTVWLVKPGSARIVEKRTLPTSSGKQTTVTVAVPRSPVIVVAATTAPGATYSWPRLLRPISRR